VEYFFFFYREAKLPKYRENGWKYTASALRVVSESFFSKINRGKISRPQQVVLF
jgi:hypothetical protein